MDHILSRYKRDLALRGFSPRTQEHYYRQHVTQQFLSYHNFPAEQLVIKNNFDVVLSGNSTEDRLICKKISFSYKRSWIETPRGMIRAVSSNSKAIFGVPKIAS